MAPQLTCSTCAAAFGPGKLVTIPYSSVEKLVADNEALRIKLAAMEKRAIAVPQVPLQRPIPPPLPKAVR